MSQRLIKIKDILKKENLDSFFISNQQNVMYLSGFSGLAPHEREAFLLITQRNTYFFTFPTYFGLVRDFEKEITPLNITRDKGLRFHLAEIISNENLKSVAFEKTDLTVSEFESLKNKLKIILIETEGFVEKIRLIKDINEIKKIQRAAEITDKAFDYIINKIKKTKSEKEIALELEFFLKKNAGEIAFSPIVAFNENAAIPHYIPSANNKLKTNSLILLDFGARYEGYCADMTRVFFFGRPKNEWIKVYNTVLNSQELALKSLKTGKKGHEIDEIARKYIINSGYPEYPHGLGHGVGLAIHESPRLRKESDDILKENMVVTVEPGIYIEGQYGLRIEDLVLLKKEKPEILSKSSKKIIIL